MPIFGIEIKKIMKKILFFASVALLMVSFAHAQEVAKEMDKTQTEVVIGEVTSSGPIMTFESKTVDYGTLEQHGEPLRVCTFTNTGTEPLVIKNARGSCGCTVPTYPKEPIMPGESSKIEIRYATNRLGKFSKTVTLTTNEVGEKHVLKVIGEVLKPETENVPTTVPSIIGGGL